MNIPALKAPHLIIITLIIAATVISPLVISKGEASSALKEKFGSEGVEKNTVTHAKFTFDLPSAWEAKGNYYCTRPCDSGVELRFVEYPAGEKNALPLLDHLEKNLDQSLKNRYNQFEKKSAANKMSANSAPYLEYEYAWQPAGSDSKQRQIIAFYRQASGDGVALILSGNKTTLHKEREAIAALLDSAAA